MLRRAFARSRSPRTAARISSRWLCSLTSFADSPPARASASCGTSPGRAISVGRAACTRPCRGSSRSSRRTAGRAAGIARSRTVDVAAEARRALPRTCDAARACSSTLPLPETVTVIRETAAAKRAATLFAASSVTVHAAVPEHAPHQPRKRAPAAGARRASPSRPCRAWTQHSKLHSKTTARSSERRRSPCRLSGPSIVSPSCGKMRQPPGVLDVEPRCRSARSSRRGRRRALPSRSGSRS